MRIGYVHIGPVRHGVRRYGSLLAAEAKSRDDLSVAEAAVDLAGGPGDEAAIEAAAERMRGVDVVHVQYNLQREKCVWGAGASQTRNLRVFLDAIDAPLAVTLHDVYPPPRGRFDPVTLLRRARWATSAPAASLAMLWRDARLVLTCSREESRRLEASGGRRAEVVPHFVERRTIAESPQAARETLGLADARVVTLLGVIHRRKGHDLVVAALAALPDDVTAVFAGRVATGGERYLDRLRSLARSRGVETRLRVTGYLDEPTLDRHLVATHLAVCPFRGLSASGSLSTWIAAGRRVLATDLPQIHEYNERVPDAIRTFSPCTADALAAAIEQHLPKDGGDADPATLRLREHLSLTTVFDEHLRLYRTVQA